MATNKSILDSLRAILGGNDLLTDPESLRHYGCDWTRVYKPEPMAIAFPRDTAQVKALVGWANQHRIGLVPSGGRTGYSGGAVARPGELVVSFERMNRILDFNPVDRLVTCEPGVVTQSLQEFALEQNLFYPVDFASSGSSQIGGNIATNAGGIKVLRYGLTRNWVAGLQVVTGAGDVLELNRGLTKNATGYDLRHLFIGSEGTLGFITQATMRLTEAPVDSLVLLLGVDQLTDIMQVFSCYQQPQLSAFEFFSDNALQRVVERFQRQRPFAAQTPYYVLMEIELSADADLDHQLELFERCLQQGWVQDGVVSQSQAQAAELWRFREDISETLSVFTPYKNDLSVTAQQVPEFLSAIEECVTRQYPDFEVTWYGHIGDGNLHLNILKPEQMEKEAFFAECNRVSEDIYRIVTDFGGSVSAEHGVGLLKKPHLGYSRSGEEIAHMRAIKNSFDPNGIMNPGKLVDILPSG